MNRITEMEITWRDFSGEGKGGMGRKVLGRKSMVSRHMVDKERLKMVWESEDSKKLYVQSMDVN